LQLLNKKRDPFLLDVLTKSTGYWVYI